MVYISYLCSYWDIAKPGMKFWMPKQHQKLKPESLDIPVHRHVLGLYVLVHYAPIPSRLSSRDYYFFSFLGFMLIAFANATTEPRPITTKRTKRSNFSGLPNDLKAWHSKNIRRTGTAQNANGRVEAWNLWIEKVVQPERQKQQWKPASTPQYFANCSAKSCWMLQSRYFKRWEMFKDLQHANSQENMTAASSPKQGGRRLLPKPATFDVLICFDELDEFNSKPYQSCAFPVWFLGTFFHVCVSPERWLKNAGTLTRNRKHAQNGYLGNKTRYLNRWKHGTALWLVRTQSCQRNAPLWSMVAATGTSFVLKVKFHLWTLNLAARMVYRCLVCTWKWTEPCESPGGMAALCPWLEWMASTRMPRNPVTAVKASFKTPTMCFDHLNVAMAQNVWLPELDPSPTPGVEIPLVGCLCVVRVCLYVLKLISNRLV